MSLIGSLEDLSLADILQIINLSQKSGVLAIRSDEGRGSIVFRGGLVRGAVVKGGPQDLRDVLVGGCFVSEEEFAAAEASGADIGQALAGASAISLERIDSLRRESVEAAVVRMFSWRSGEFSFDLRSEDETQDPAIYLETGLNAQYLAMEGLRVQDESARDLPLDATAPPADTSASPETLDVEPAEVDPSSEAQREAPASQQGLGETPSTATKPPVVAIDPDLRALEWVKGVLAPQHPRIHVFQRADLGLVRIRQYLARAEIPLVLVSPQAPGDPLCGIRDNADFVRRLKQQSPAMSVFWLYEDGSQHLAGPEVALGDGIAVRPASHQLANTRAAGQLELLAQRLWVALGTPVSEAGATPAAVVPEAGASSLSSEALGRLKEMTARLSESSSRGEVLPLVIRFATESFSRVALFMVRDALVVGIAQSGLARAGGPDDRRLREVALHPASCPWLRDAVAGDAVERVHAIRPDDLPLVERLGDRAPVEAYLAPIESSGRVVALLYADNLPEGRPIGDTSALEVALHHAGLALDRAALERALAEIGDDGAPLQHVASQPREQG